jgi:hypothetical protein
MIRSLNQYVDVNAFEDYLNAQQEALPELPEVTDLSSRVTRILGDNPGRVSPITTPLHTTSRSEGMKRMSECSNTTRCNFKAPTPIS